MIYIGYIIKVLLLYFKQSLPLLLHFFCQKLLYLPITDFNIGQI